MINHEQPSAPARILIFFEVAKETTRCLVAPWNRRWVDGDAWSEAWVNEFIASY